MKKKLQNLEEDHEREGDLINLGYLDKEGKYHKNGEFQKLQNLAFIGKDGKVHKNNEFMKKKL